MQNENKLYDMILYECISLFQGYVAFSSQGDRIALTQIEQMVNGSYVILGYFDTQSDNLTLESKEKWSGEC
jgi:gamma-aminobutyric acid type B receptor